MGQGVHIGAAVTGAIMSMAAGSLAHAADASANVDLTAYLGVWGDGVGYNCKSEPGTESQPISLAKDENDGYSLSAYEFFCSLTDLEQRKTTVAAEKHCGHEGTDETSTGRIELGLMSGGQLVLADGGINVLTRCPVAN